MGLVVRRGPALRPHYWRKQVRLTSFQPLDTRRLTSRPSGVGLGICQRLINDFLHHHPLTSHLILIPTTRSPAKSRETVLALRRHLESVSRTSPALRRRAVAESPEHDYIWTDSFRRVHILSPQVDLCDIPDVYSFAATLVRGTLSNPPDSDGMVDVLTDVRLPRLDAVIFNAGFGGWTGFSFLGAIKSFLTEGVVTAVTWPTFKIDTVGAVVPGHSRGVIAENKAAGIEKQDDTVLGAVFCSNVFGHYLLGHALLPLLVRDPDDPARPGKIIWTSSIEASPVHLRLDDLQGVATRGSYESSKRLTDILALTATLPGVRPYSASYFRLPQGSGDEAGENEPEDVEEKFQPRTYVSHPGVFVSTLFPVPFFLLWAYRIALFLARWLGSPWHNVDGYTASTSSAWLALEAPDVLMESGADKTKWGSACDRLGRPVVKATEVEGWGWDGRVDGGRRRGFAHERGVLSRRRGRRPGAVELTQEEREKFEVLGADCWKEMEKLRGKWEARLGVKALGK